MEAVCILGYSVDIPNDGMVVLPNLDADLKDRIAQAFIEIADTEEGEALTQALFNVTEFARVEDPSVYDVVREVSKTFQR